MGAVPLTRLRDSQDERSAVWHGVDGVGDQVGKCLAQLARQRRDFNVPVILLDHVDLS